MLEVDVDVGRLVALARNEALEEHLHPRRIDRCDAEAVAHRGIRCRASSLAEDLFRARELDYVADGKKERFVFRLGDDLELVLDQFSNLGALRFGRGFRRKTPDEALFRELPQIRRQRLALRHDLLGIFVAELVE